MPALHLLGTGAAVTDPHRTTTMLAMEDQGRSILVDCGGDLFQRALLAGLSLEGIEALVITHEHPDHVSGFPLFVERIWLAGRKEPLPIFGIRPALEQAQRLLDAFDTSGWDIPELQWQEIGPTRPVQVLSSDIWAVTAAPGFHGVPVVGLRFEHLPSGFVTVYSSDTEPCESIAQLASGCDLLVHEATGRGPGHTSIEQAVEIAEAAGASNLILVHLPVGTDNEMLLRFSESPVKVTLGEELDRFEF